jgi:hypothetical protein
VICCIWIDSISVVDWASRNGWEAYFFYQVVFVFLWLCSMNFLHHIRLFFGKMFLWRSILQVACLLEFLPSFGLAQSLPDKPMLNRDSMIAKMNLLQSDTAKIRFLQETALTINAMNPELMLFLADSSFTIAQNLKLKHEMAIGQRLRAFAKQRLGMMSESMREYLDALRTFEELHDTVGLAHCYNGLGIISFEQKKYDQALEY